MNTQPQTRQVAVTLHECRDAFTCTFCGARVRDGLGCWTAEIVEPGGNVPVPGEFCSERCGETEAQLTVIVDAYLSDSNHPGYRKLLADIRRAS